MVMSGDVNLQEEPVIFYSEEMTMVKMIVLKQKGIKLKLGVIAAKNNSDRWEKTAFILSIDCSNNCQLFCASGILEPGNKRMIKGSVSEGNFRDWLTEKLSIMGLPKS